MTPTEPKLVTVTPLADRSAVVVQVKPLRVRRTIVVYDSTYWRTHCAQCHKEILPGKEGRWCKACRGLE